MCALESFDVLEIFLHLWITLNLLIGLRYGTKYNGMQLFINIEHIETMILIFTLSFEVQNLMFCLSYPFLYHRSTAAKGPHTLILIRHG